jgi:hypothetical protein
VALRLRQDEHQDMESMCYSVNTLASLAMEMLSLDDVYRLVISVNNCIKYVMCVDVDAC